MSPIPSSFATSLNVETDSISAYMRIHRKSFPRRESWNDKYKSASDPPLSRRVQFFDKQTSNSVKVDVNTDKTSSASQPIRDNTPTSASTSMLSCGIVLILQLVMIDTNIHSPVMFYRCFGNVFLVNILQ